MRYRLGVDEMEPDHWVGWVLDLPACFSSAQTQDGAVARAPERIAEYYAWLSAHDAASPVPAGPIETEVVGVCRAFPCSQGPDYLVNAFFEDDRRPLGYWDVGVALRLLSWTRQDLLRTVETLSQEWLVQPVAGEVRGSIAGILRHVAGAENWYLGHLDVGLDRSQVPDDPFEALRVVRAQTRAQLVRLIGNERVVSRRDELWSARKIVRRTLWHECDHTRHIARLLAE